MERILSHRIDLNTTLVRVYIGYLDVIPKHILQAKSLDVVVRLRKSSQVQFGKVIETSVSSHLVLTRKRKSALGFAWVDSETWMFL